MSTHLDPLELLTISEVSRLIRRSRSALYVDIAAGRLRTVHLGRSTRVWRRDLEDYVFGNGNGCEQDK